jgi:hypothetical protein
MKASETELARDGIDVGEKAVSAAPGHSANH